MAWLSPCFLLQQYGELYFYDNETKTKLVDLFISLYIVNRAVLTAVPDSE